MDGSLIALALSAPAAAGGFLGFFVGLRVCGPRLEICWTERHPRELAEEVASGQRKLNTLTKQSQRLVLAEIARIHNGLTVEESTDFLTLTGVGHRFERDPACIAVRDWAEQAWYEGPTSGKAV